MRKMRIFSISNVHFGGIMIVKGFPLIKFQSTEKIKDLQSGRIYMNSLAWYRKHENDKGDVVVGDSFEAMFHVNKGKLILSSIEETIEIDDRLIFTSASNDYVYCMFSVNPYNDSFTFTSEQKESIKAFGDSALLILDINEFFNRVRTAALREKYDIYGDFVRYYDEKADSANLILSLMSGIHNVAFWKRKKYVYQQEFRFLVHAPKCEKEHLELNIGDIRDISKVFKTSEILNAKVVKAEEKV